MNRLAVLAFLLPLQLLPACHRAEKADDQAGQSTTTGAAAPAANGYAAKLIGSWIATDGSGETLDFTATTMTAGYPKVTNKAPPITYKVSKEDGRLVVLGCSMDMPGGKTFKADDQNVTFVDDDTIDKRNAKNKSGNTFKRKK